MSMKHLIIIGADHRAFKLKESLKNYLSRKGLVIEDVTPKLVPGDDYPLIAKHVVRLVLKGHKGMLLCDTGSGIAIAANRFCGIRAVPVYSVFEARHSRTDNDSNVLCLGEETTSLPLAKQIVDAWLGTKFSGATRHKRRIKQIENLKSK